MIRRWRAVLGAGILAVLCAFAVGSAPAAQAAQQPSPEEVRGAQWYLESLGVLKAHGVTKGAGVKVCVIDTGADPAISELAGAKFEGGFDLSGKGSPDGLKAMKGNHGNAMTAYIVGQGTSPTGGLLGVAPAATLMSASTAGTQSEMTDQSVQAFKECADRGAQVINASFVAGIPREALAYAQARDVVIVAGVGNEGAQGFPLPAAGFGVMSVAGVDSTLSADPLSNYGGYKGIRPAGPDLSKDTQGVALAGPSSVTGGTPETCGGFWQPSPFGYKQACGTSDATAVVSGVVALVRAAHPELNAANVINRVLVTAKPPTDGAAVPSPHYGFGVVDAYAAVTAEVPLVTENPLGSQYTESMGVWNRGVKPKRAEPVVGVKLAPGEIKDAIPAAAASPSVDPSGSVSSDPGAASSSGSSSLLVTLGLGLLAILVVIGAAVFLWMRSRAKQQQLTDHPYPRETDSGPGQRPPTSS